MKDGRPDFELLQAFARRGDQVAFAEVVRRHVNLVYAVALRKVDADAVAQEVAQNVFTILARKAWQFGSDDSLASWLHRTTVLEAKAWWRGELRRRRREEQAIKLGTTMNASEDQSSIRALTPLLDEALLALPEKDRAALLLRYYERRSLREISAALTTTEGAAQKRVTRALDGLARFFHRRGYRTISVAVAAAALEHTAISAPASLAGGAVAAAVLAASPAPFAALASCVAALSNARVALLCAGMLAVPIGWNALKAQQIKSDLDREQFQLARAQETLADAQTRQNLAVAQPSDAAIAGDSDDDARNREAQARFAILRARLRNVLAGGEPWPNGLPWVRLPKWTLRSISINADVLTSAGELNPLVTEMLNLTPGQKAEVEGKLHDYLTAVNNLAAQHGSLTNPPVGASPALTVAFSVPPLGEDLRLLQTNLVQNLQTELGPDASRPVLAHVVDWSDAFLGSIHPDEPRNYWMTITTNAEGNLAGQIMSDHFSMSSRALPLPTDLAPPFLKGIFQDYFRNHGVTAPIFSEAQ